MTPPNNKRYIIIRGREFSLWTIIGSLILLFLSVMMVIWFFNNFERVTKTNYDLTERAIFNPYLAAETLINQQGGVDQEYDEYSDDYDEEADYEDSYENNVTPYATTLLDSNIKSLLDDLPEIDEALVASGQRPVLIINSMTTKLTQERFDALQAWVEDGGHLITFTGKGIGGDDVDELAEYVDTLKTSGADATRVQNDSQLKSMLNELNTSNQFLAQMGILAVVKDSDCDDDCVNTDGFEDKEMLEALEQLEEEYGIAIDPETGQIKSKDDSEDSNKQADEANSFKSYLDELKSNAYLTIVNVPNAKTSDNKTDSNSDDISNVSPPLMLKKIRAYDAINTDIFGLMYPNSMLDKRANTYEAYQAPDYQVSMIRQYLKSELERFSQTSEQTISSATVSSNTKGTIDPLDYDDAMFKRFINLVLALEDDELLELFVPASEAYIDVPLGEGRISVLLDRNTFTNPDPNLDISNHADDKEPMWSSFYGMKLSTWTPLIELVENSYRFNISTVDNADLLLELTKNANEVWILPTTDVEPLPVMLWRQAKFAVLGLGLLIMFWLWSLYDRFGKGKSLSGQKAHDILRYFQQVGRYGWDKDRANTLLRLSRQQAKLILYEHLPRLAIGQKFSTDMNFHALASVHASNPNANPLAKLSDKDLARLSGLLLAEYQKKHNAGYADSSRPLLVKSKNEVSYLDNSDPIRHIDAERLLSPEQLSQALITPLQETYSAQTFLEMTQTLWLLNWILK